MEDLFGRTALSVRGLGGVQHGISVLRALVCFLYLLTAGACVRGGSVRPPLLPPPSPSTSVGAGDLLSIVVIGESLPSEYRVQSDGTIDFPYVGILHVGEREPQEIAHLLKGKLVEGNILTDPQIVLAVKQYNSKRISVIGQVGKPGTVPWVEGMKLVDTLSQVGWVTSQADTTHLLLTRQLGNGRSLTVLVNLDAITEGAIPDIPLQPGDTIKLGARLF